MKSPKFFKKKKLKIGLALGGGGIRGLAHIGVLKVLEQNNIPIDFIAGTSAGALIGGAYSFDKNIEKIEKIALSFNRRKFLSLVDPSLRRGLIKGEKAKKFIESYIGQALFKDLEIPFLTTATDLETGESILLNKGKVSDAIRASISIPLVFQPTKLNNRILVDGGLSTPVPVQAVRNMGADIVIAINLNTDYSNKNKNDKFNFYEIANNSMNILRYYLSSWNSEKADLIINPRVGMVAWSKYIKPQSLILEGEKAGKKALKSLKKII